MKKNTTILHDTLVTMNELHEETDKNLLKLSTTSPVKESNVSDMISSKREEIKRIKNFFDPYKKGAEKESICEEHAKEVFETLLSLIENLSTINKASKRLLERYTAKN